jgi:hypothetical protein
MRRAKGALAAAELGGAVLLDDAKAVECHDPSPI